MDEFASRFDNKIDGKGRVSIPASFRAALAKGIGTLPEREAMVLQLYFVEEMNLEEIGQTLGVGAARVCQIKKTALDKLRNSLSEWR